MRDTLVFVGICTFTALLWAMVIVHVGEDERPPQPKVWWLHTDSNPPVCDMKTCGVCYDTGVCLPPMVVIHPTGTFVNRKPLGKR